MANRRITRHPTTEEATIDVLPPGTSPIKLSSKTLAHISSGLYRSTANALKELASNAFDADAKWIRINTNFPEFDVLTCRDNGGGMTHQQFIDLMSGGIGDSLKRVGTAETAAARTEKGRPVIGRIGIGMLAIAQICYEFKVISHHRKSRKAFEAVVDLRPYRSLDISKEPQKKEYEVGYYKSKAIDYDPQQAGFLISTNDLLPTFMDRYRADVTRKAFKKIPKDFEGFIREVSKPEHKSINSLGDYWRLFWELSVACPIEYVGEGPFRRSLLKDAVLKDSRDTAEKAVKIINEQKRLLKKYDFQVIVDELSLRKPILVPPKPTMKVEGRLTPVEINDQIIGLPLKVRGYIYTQGKAIYPHEERGILIRVKNVAIGNYDWSCLNYGIIQGFRFDWLTGEICVEEGLEEALNIDRHSFNEVHPHYLALQKHVHSTLKDVFSEARRGSESANRLTTVEAEKALLSGIRKVLRVTYKLDRIESPTQSGGPIEIDRKRHVVLIYEKHPLCPNRKAKRVIAEKVLIAFKLAQAHTRSPDAADEKVLAILTEVL